MHPLDPHTWTWDFNAREMRTAGDGLGRRCVPCVRGRLYVSRWSLMGQGGGYPDTGPKRRNPLHCCMTPWGDRLWLGRHCHSLIPRECASQSHSDNRLAPELRLSPPLYTVAPPPSHVVPQLANLAERWVKTCHQEIQCERSALRGAAARRLAEGGPPPDYPMGTARRDTDAVAGRQQATAHRPRVGPPPLTADIEPPRVQSRAHAGYPHANGWAPARPTITGASTLLGLPLVLVTGKAERP